MLWCLLFVFTFNGTDILQVSFLVILKNEVIIFSFLLFSLWGQLPLLKNLKKLQILNFATLSSVIFLTKIIIFSMHDFSFNRFYLRKVDKKIVKCECIQTLQYLIQLSVGTKNRLPKKKKNERFCHKHWRNSGKKNHTNFTCT